jgi:hypothetical protein
MITALAAVVTIHAPGDRQGGRVCGDRCKPPLPLEVGPCADVLAQEARWLTAITAADVATVEQILGPNFKHVNADGQFFDRAAEVASMENCHSR